MAKEEGAEIVDLRFTDLPGQVQHLSVPVHELTEDKFENGQPFDGSSIRGFQEIQESDMLLDLDPDTAYMDPFTKHPTLNITCFVKDPVTGEDYSRDPRNIAKKAELYLKQSGIADLSYWGPEAEFYIFDSIRYDQSQFEGYYHIDSVAGAWSSGAVEEGGNLGYKPRFKGGYFALPPVDKYQDLRTDMVLNLEKVGLTIEVHHHEVGTAGQAEIDMRYDTLLTTADNVMKYKYVVKNTAYQAGKTVTFMPKPLFMDNGSGMHTHQSLWQNDENLFWDEVGYGGISDMARWYIGGLLAHAPSLLAFTNPTTNSYRRLVPGYEAPIKLVYSQRNRSACVRIPLGSKSPQAQATGVPHAGPLVQPVPGVQRDADGGPRRHQEQDRAAGAGGQGPLRPAARGAGEREAGPGLTAGGSRQPGGRPPVAAGGRRLHAGRHRHVDRVQAPRGARRGRVAPAPPRVLAVLRRVAARPIRNAVRNPSAPRPRGSAVCAHFRPAPRRQVPHVVLAARPVESAPSRGSTV